MTLRWGIDYDLDEKELNRREAYELMFRRVQVRGQCGRLLCIDTLDRYLQTKNLFYIWSHEDGTIEYAYHSSEDETQVYLRRDWTKHGFRNISYNVCISDPVSGTRGYFRVRSIAQMQRVIERWQSRFGPE